MMEHYLNPRLLYALLELFIVDLECRLSRGFRHFFSIHNDVHQVKVKLVRSALTFCNMNFDFKICEELPIVQQATSNIYWEER